MTLRERRADGLLRQWVFGVIFFPLMFLVFLRLLQVGTSYERLGPAFEALADAVRRGRIRRLAIERVDGEPVIGSAWEETLVELGFRAGPRKLTLTA